MARTATLIHDENIDSVQFTYRRVNPATGLYYDNTEITACTVQVRNAETGAILQATTAMTYSSTIGGYKYDWTFGSSLIGVEKVDIYFIPTRAASVAAALAPQERMEMFIHGFEPASAVAERVATFIHDENIDSMQLVYRKIDPTTGTYFTSSKITGCNVRVRNAATGAVILASTAMTYNANLGGYEYDWTYGTSIDEVEKLDVHFIPARSGVTSSLVPEERMEIFLYHVEGVFNFNGFALNGMV